MTTAPATPQQMRDRLLQAIDSQSNICNMVAVLDVITNLEKFPITKEALEETRLGKLINDLRKKTKDEDLAKRAKKLLRNWQKLIEPGQNDTPTRSAPGTPGSANGGAHPCRTDITPLTVPPPGKIGPEVKNRNDIHNTYSPKAEKSGSRKRKDENRDSLHPPAKMPKTSAYEQMSSCTSPSTNGIGGSPETPSERDTLQPSDRNRTEHLENDRHSKIPVNAVRPHSNSPGLTKLPSTSSLIKTAVLQQHARLEGGSGGPHQPKSPRFSSHSPRSAAQEMLSKRSSTCAPKESLSSPSPSSAQVPSPSPVLQSSLSPATECFAVERSPTRHEPSLHFHGSTEPAYHPQHSTVTQECPPGSLQASHIHKAPDSHRHGTSVEASAGECEVVTSCPDGKRSKKYRSRDYVVNLQGQPLEDKTKPVRLKERRLTFDPVTGQIKPLTPKESHFEEESPVPQPPPPLPPPPPPAAEPNQQKPPAPLPSPFQQTNWKELSRNEIIQSYLNIQSNVLTSSGAQTHGAHFFMTEYLKREEHDTKETRKTHVLVPSKPESDLPGVTRDVSEDDLNRINTSHWPGVNGCCDTVGTWYDWTECIALDPHGDEGKLNILPYVCLD
ncbi:mediator of RNA polymerase II transcription subunit 26 isoform X1 [Alosa sapidissima]|uniref:mediator of RNA polymerase II transcription subunit 26 isoform X1 n=1 Tax=Alosa sapidissima TaxID=34773 RepID=UPI001C09C227|nr:mediator of RNA polymerase II transcription subunit 26 isoform X1 [Alosa sapidissima]